METLFQHWDRRVASHSAEHGGHLAVGRPRSCSSAIPRKARCGAPSSSMLSVAAAHERTCTGTAQ